MSGEEVIYHDMSPKSAYIAPPPPPPPQQIPTGAPAEEEVVDEAAPTKKKCSLFTKICIGVIVLCAIVLSVTLTRPGALDAFGKKTPSAAEEGVTNTTTYEPTYFPTYAPTYAPTYSPTPGDEEEEEEEEEAVVTTTTTVAATEAAVVTTAAAVTTTEAPVDDLDNSTITNATEAAAVVDVNSTEAAVVTTTEATTTTTTTTTIKQHPVCGDLTNYKVFKIQFTPKTSNATYTLTNKETGDIYASIQPGELPLNVETEERVCIPGGEYEYSMTAGACVKGYFRGNLILFSCNEGVITLDVPNWGEVVEEEEGEVVIEGEVVVDEEVVVEEEEPLV